MEKDKMELVRVVVFFRHGDRTPLSRKIGRKNKMKEEEVQFWMSTLPSTKTINHLDQRIRVVNKLRKQQIHDPVEILHGGIWPFGQLTKKGLQDMCLKGQQIRNTYASLLSGVSCPSCEIFVHSTTFWRTIRSAQSIIHGMFPRWLKSNGSVINCQHCLSDQQLKIHVDESNALSPVSILQHQRPDPLFLNDAPDGLLSTAEGIREYIDLKEADKMHWATIRDLFICRKAHAWELPSGLQDSVIEAIDKLDGWRRFKRYSDRMYCLERFRSGLRMIYTHLSHLSESDCRLKLSLFSVHDNSLIALVQAFNLMVEPVLPPYGATLAIEIYKWTSTYEYFIQFKYQNEQIFIKDQEQEKFYSLISIINILHNLIFT
jgi:hypothetical protein